jgi:hypothetical protein
MKKSLVFLLASFLLFSVGCATEKPNFSGKQKHKKQHSHKKKLNKKDCDCPSFD